MAEDSKRVRIMCPGCHEQHVVDIPASAMDDYNASGLLTVLLRPSCDHACMVFIDKNFQMRGGYCADMEIGMDDDGVLNGNDLMLASREVSHMSDLALKFATEVIKLNASDASIITSINAQDKIKAVEIALIHGDIRGAGGLLASLHEFVARSNMTSFAGRLLQSMKKIDNLVANKVDFDWNAIIVKHENVDDDVEFTRLKALYYERVRKILAELEYEAICGNIERASVDMKKGQLMDLVDEL